MRQIYSFKSVILQSESDTMIIDILCKQITELQRIPTLSKHEHLVTGILNAIDEKKLKRGDKLPSINEMVGNIGYARKTIVKSYEELKEKGIVTSKNHKGYFIVSEKTEQVTRVALVMYGFRSFQETLYNAFRKHLKPNVEVDVFFHHNNVEMLETILLRIEHAYQHYIIAPIDDKRIIKMLLKIPIRKLLLIDRFVQLSDQHMHITQDFKTATHDKLSELLPTIKKFDRLFFVHMKDSETAKDALDAFQEFIIQKDIKGAILNAYPEAGVEKGNVYFVRNDELLWQMLKEAQEKNLVLGKDIGIISYDDSLVKEMIHGGITTISSDFSQMGALSAKWVNEQENTQYTIPTHLMRRNSI